MQSCNLKKQSATQLSGWLGRERKIKPAARTSAPAALALSSGGPPQQEVTETLAGHNDPLDMRIAQQGVKGKNGWGRLPNTIALDPDIEAGALVIFAYRITIVGNWVLTRRDIQRLVRHGLAERAFWRALRNLTAPTEDNPSGKGLIKRHKRANGRQGHGTVFNDELILPLGVGSKYRRVERSWFEGNLSVKASALHLFIRASGDERARPWHIAKRFNWSLPTIKTAAEELINAQLVELHGPKQTPVYAVFNSRIVQSKKEQRKMRQSKTRRQLPTVRSIQNVSPSPIVSQQHSGLQSDIAPASELRNLAAFAAQLVGPKGLPTERSPGHPHFTEIELQDLQRISTRLGEGPAPQLPEERQRRRIALDLQREGYDPEEIVRRWLKARSDGTTRADYFQYATAIRANGISQRSKLDSTAT